MRESLRAGIAIYNAGHYHAAHDAWEDHWLDLEPGTSDERLLHGLIQFTAAVHHANGRNWAGCVGLAESALEYLAGIPADYRGVDLETVRAALGVLARDPEVIERRSPWGIRHEGEVVTIEDLDVREVTIAAAVLAEELAFDVGAIERAGEYAVTDFEAGRDDSQCATLLREFLRAEEDRGIVHDRLTAHVERRASREADVDGLFE